MKILYKNVIQTLTTQQTLYVNNTLMSQIANEDTNYVI
jgi:hypothetical protein